MQNKPLKHTESFTDNPNYKDFEDKFITKVEEVSGDPFSESTPRHQYEALAELVMEAATKKWAEHNAKLNKMEDRQVYFFSIEFLIGRLLKNYINDLDWNDQVEKTLTHLNLDYTAIQSCENDPALGNGGLGRLMACFLNSSAALGFPAHGNGIRYKYGLFEQKIVNHEQVEVADVWLRDGYPFEVAKPEKAVVVKYYGHVRSIEENGKLHFIHEDYEPVLAVPYDIPVLGYRNDVVNSLRLWSASPVEDFDLTTFNQGHFIKAMQRKSEAESISQILYPSDHGFEGKLLRLKQEYFFVAAGLKRIIRRYKHQHQGSLEGFSNKMCIHINDTHPALCIPEFMRLLMDEEGYEWEEAWAMTVPTMSFTNHTVLPEALETWPITMMETLLPRIYQIIDEINRRFINEMNWEYPEEQARNYHISILKEGNVHMAHLAIIGSHSINGVAELHSKILREETFKDFYAIYPDRFTSVTNGVTQRRFQLSANRPLKTSIEKAIGNTWETPGQMENLKALLPFAEDAAFRQELQHVKRLNKEALAAYIHDTQKILINPDSIFDIQVKRIHEYKRQLLNILHVMFVYNQLRAHPHTDIVPKTYFFAGKAAPSYYYAKEVIRLINTVAEKINNDPAVKDLLKVVFIPNFNVSKAEIIYPAAELSEQISTAGKEASGTGNMKFMMNGALTLGTLDGANIEIAEAVGKENIFTFGLTAEQVFQYNANHTYRSLDVFEKDPRLQEVINQLVNGFYDANSFQAIYDSLLLHGDAYFVLADFDAYCNIQATASSVYQNQDDWLKKSIINIAHSGMFSADRSIVDYQKRVWKIK